ncbi:NmrA family NAD(P)-binding protein [Mesorhizobium onobrychidis]|uniref:NmrA family NAD(P)-binding protein n=1 Tax=Mesorhizobium onobrychidis TaxID=2775404 RepID=A0ABY5R2L6_9HYPH|nr:NmrA family NAD(P)-binding protein [Mesorhizobium onobrychidis]
MNDRIVTVFGGSGFLGRRVVRHLCKRGFSVRIASRHPERAKIIDDTAGDRFTCRY